MKKQILMVSALVMVALSSMLVACDKKEKDAASNGCTCTYNGDPEKFSASEMKEEGASTCSELQEILEDDYGYYGVKCK